MKTDFIKHNEITRDWFVVDAAGQTLGRLASNVAQVLRGKNKPFFTPHANMGDFVVVINADKIAVTGAKEVAKKYWRHSGFVGHHKELSLSKMREVHPDRIIRHAVKGMLPHNRLGRCMIKALKIYIGPEHPHQAQQPQPLEF